MNPNSLPAVSSVRVCPILPFQKLEEIVSLLSGRVGAYSHFLDPNSCFHHPPDFTKPAPDYKPPHDDRFPLRHPDEPRPILKRDPANPGHWRWVFPKPKRPRPDTS